MDFVWDGTNYHVAQRELHLHKKHFLQFGKPLKQQYDATGATLGDVTNVSYTMWAHVTNGDATAYQPYVLATCRTRYTS